MADLNIIQPSKSSGLMNSCILYNEILIPALRIAQEETEEMDEEMLKERESGIMELGNK